MSRPLRFEGVGLFTGVPCAVTIEPPPPGQRGLWFLRQGATAGPIEGSTARVLARPRQTVLVAKGADAGTGVQTVEHAMSALAAFGITDALLRVEGPEIPILDGSAGPFAGALAGTGVVVVGPGPGPAPIIVRSRVEVADGNARITAEPGPSSPPGEAALDATFELDYGPGAPLPAQTARIILAEGGASSAEFLREIAPARTFCTEQEAHALRAAGLFKHLTAGDIPVYGPQGPIEGAARFANEPARHKVLDLIGDLALAGRPIRGRIVAARAGHALNHAMARALLAHASLSSAHG